MKRVRSWSADFFATKMVLRSAVGCDCARPLDANTSIVRRAYRPQSIHKRARARLGRRPIHINAFQARRRRALALLCAPCAREGRAFVHASPCIAGSRRTLPFNSSCELSLSPYAPPRSGRHLPHDFFRAHVTVYVVPKIVSALNAEGGREGPTVCRSFSRPLTAPQRSREGPTVCRSSSPPFR